MNSPGILQLLNSKQQNSNENDITNAIEKLIDSCKSVGNADALAQMLAKNNPKMQEAIAHVKANGGDPKTACIELLRQKGIDPSIITKKVEGK